MELGNERFHEYCELFGSENFINNETAGVVNFAPEYCPSPRELTKASPLFEITGLPYCNIKAPSISFALFIFANSPMAIAVLRILEFASFVFIFEIRLSNSSQYFGGNAIRAFVKISLFQYITKGSIVKGKARDPSEAR